MTFPHFALAQSPAYNSQPKASKARPFSSSLKAQQAKRLQALDFLVADQNSSHSPHVKQQSSRQFD